MNIQTIINDLLVIYAPKRITALTSLSASRITKYKNGDTGATLDSPVFAVIDLHRRNKKRIEKQREINIQEDRDYVEQKSTRL